MERRFIQTGSRWEALAGYSRAVIDGDWIFVSGTVGQDYASGIFAAGAAAQCERALDTIEAALAQAQAGLADVVRVCVYVPERGDVPAVSEVLRRRFGDNRPCNTTVCCQLAVPQALVELEVTARRRS
ncbi:RidA family protein [Verminephrobacter aporrectodeae]|uniref:RidA family protein n=1 Tax=Verminephrobacter aporrectodeae subsp. tuberculatae TaxID=1110392 RepID=A0ABT3KWU3_9BURK|nr:RidA family protein [Verminephrobacter aporrectodeae]MCW5221783.1 RidA family protein [Verminephrobacter aporrectodeae subsp. tuberculatae]MCW5258093.1 RidA family protein [Verminephrobacter aporrectodeae subsp. tuberculatae]MCW5291074.1 RidA family protein [Verminephrobacter aporrectodeae subsp. tuberculatae]MCW5322765.1 RidA family protein [Verminephrobacter aporrectodeae subsp. tuberculatae]MCW8167190.1 RidA family protein [Verminephrobacter aporrectodeae subsp. tuberculatae]